MEYIEENKTSYLRIWQIAYPIIIGGLAENIINVTDTAFVGKLGQAALGAVGMGSLYYYTFVLIAIGLAMGTQILVGRRNGEKNYAAIGDLLDNSLYLFAIIAIALFAVLHFTTPYLLRMLISSDEIYELARSFVNIRSYGILFICLSVVFKSFHIGITRTRVIIFVTAGMAAINVALNYMLIFGKGIFHPMGVRGSATASIVSEFLGLVGYIFFVRFTRSNRKFNLFKFPRPRWSLSGDVLKVGFPLMLQGWVSVSSWFVFFLLIEKMGELPLAVSAIIKSVYLVFMIPVWGFGSATNTLVSNVMGENRPEKVMMIVRRVTLMSVSLSFLLGLINIFLPRQVIGIYNHDPNIISESIGPLRVITLAILILSAGSVLFNTVSGTGATRISLFVELITLSLYMAYVLLVTLGFRLPLVYVWMSEWVYMSSMAVFSLLYLLTGKWKHIKL